MKKNVTRKTVAILVAAIMMLGIAAQAFAAGTYTKESFTDVKKSDWFYTFVEGAAENKWLSGYPDGSFGPYNSVTYAEWASILTRAFFPEELEKYNGAADPWFLKYTGTARDLGLFDDVDAVYDGYKDAAIVGEPISRAHMASMIYWALCEKDVKRPTAEEIAAAEASTPDVSMDTTDCGFSICYVKATGILSGEPSGRFNPSSAMSRAEAAVALTKIDEYLAKNAKDPGTSGDTSNPGGTGDTSSGTTTPVTPSTGGKDANGYTLASSVNSAKPNVGKSDEYKTKGRAAAPNRNGFYTSADVEIGDAQLVYELLPMVNEARATEGLAPLSWTNLDSFEEYTLLRSYELTKKWSHIRPEDQYSFASEIIVIGAVYSDDAFNSWMNSPGHKKAIMDDAAVTMCAARCGDRWIITFGGKGHPGLVENGADVDYVSWNGRYTGPDLDIWKP